MQIPHERITLKIRIKPTTIEGLVLCLFFSPHLFFYINTILSAIGNSLSSEVLYILYIILSLQIYLKVLKKDMNLFAVVFSIVCVITGISIVLSPGITKYLIPSNGGYGQIVFYLIIYIPIFLGSMSFKDNEVLMRKASKYSEIILMLVVISFFVRIVIYRMGNVSLDYMTYAYYSLPSIFICFYNGLHKRKIDLVLAILSSVIILIGGCRGALVTLIMFFALYYFTLIDYRSFTNRILISLVIIIVSIIFNIGSVFEALGRMLSISGYSSRTLLTLAGQSFQDTEAFLDIGGRADFWQNSIRNISMFGAHGVFGDRLLLEGSYPHNFILELMLDFGGILGTLVFLSFFAASIIAYRKAKHINTTCILWCISGFVTYYTKMMLSASYLTSNDFWFFFGIACWILRTQPDLNHGYNQVINPS